MSIWCVGHSFVTSIVQVFDFWLTRKTPVWTKSLKSEQMRLQKSVNNKKCLFYYSKLFRNFKCPKMALRWAKISNSKYSYWMHNLEFESHSRYFLLLVILHRHLADCLEDYIKNCIADEFTENMSFQIYWIYYNSRPLPKYLCWMHNLQFEFKVV